MRRSTWLHGLRASLAHSNRLRPRSAKRRLPPKRRPRFEPLEERALLATLTVNSPLDNITPGDGLVTLREAIIAANTNTTTDLGQTGSGADAIQFDSVVFATPKTVPLTFGEIIVTESLSLNGPGRDLLTINAQQQSRVFNITAASGEFTIRGLTLTGGSTQDSGGAVRSMARLALDQSIVSGNTAAEKGGGVYTRSPLTVTGSTISGNRTSGSDMHGGGLYAGTIDLSNSIVSGNSTSGSGGGIAAFGKVTVSNSTIHANTAAGDGGGFVLISVFNPDFGIDGPPVSISASTISGNTAGGTGGGFRGGSHMDVTASNITDNRAQGHGGGFYAPAVRQSGYFNGNVRITDSTVSGNQATRGGGFWAGYKSTLSSVIVTGNVGGGFFSQFGGNVESCTIANNNAAGPGGGIFATGGITGFRNIHRSAALVVTSSTVTGNTSGASGGGIYVGGHVTLTNSTVSQNRAMDAGGGIFVDTIYTSTRTGFYVFGHATLNSCTVSANESQGPGGGINARVVNLNSSTVSGNRGSTGGGVYSFNDASIRDSTIAENIAADGAGGGLWNGDDHTIPVYNYPDPSTATVERSIIAHNTSSAGSPDLRLGGGTFTVTSSLIGNNAGTPLTESQTFDANGNLIGSAAGSGIIDPRLASLADNGGPTRTHALLPCSPAIDAIAYYSAVPIPAHDYQLNGSLADFLGGPSLLPSGGNLVSTGYEFGPNQGLNLSSAVTNPAHYSIEIVFKWTALSGGWQKIIDFHNLVSDVGLYTAGNGLHFLNTAFTSGLFSPETNYHLVLTRNDTTGIVRVYLNGNEVLNFVDSQGHAVLDGPDRILRFFQDDTITNQAQAQGGIVDRIRIYNQVLSAADVTAILNAPPVSFPEFDQRGTQFVRARDGDGDGNPRVDMGAYELQSPQPQVMFDYGDAPDTAVGIGARNYNTLASDNGPSHAIVPGLRLGASIDGDSGTLQNGAANADDVNSALQDDEDGVIDPAADLVLTIGAQPTVNVRVTNTTGSVAALYGWIDFNANGVFENATERASVSVPSGTDNGNATLVFPAVPPGFIGTTYARFRVSTDAAAANPTGPAADGEVEDFRVTINRPATAMADPAKTKKMASGTGGGPALANGDMFGSAVAAIGDLDGDGVEDMAVGAPSQTGSGSAGAVFVQFMNADGTVKASQRIASGVGGGPVLASGDYFGHAVAAIGDLNGDGITDIAVGADKDDTGGYNRGAVFVLFLNANGTVKSSSKIAHNLGGGPAFLNNDRFGSSITSLGDLDGDGIVDLAVGAAGDDTDGSYRGAVYVLFMNANGTVKSSQKIASGVGGGPVLADIDVFGIGVASLGDIDGDRVNDLAVGTFFDDTGGTGRGAVHVLFLNSNGTVKASQKIASSVGGGPVLDNGDYFGRSVAALGDLDGDGIMDLAVGAYRDDTGGADRGALHVLLLNADGTVKESTKIASGTGGGPTLLNDGRFGSGVAALGDLDGDGIIELAVGAETDNTGGVARGAVYVLSLTGMNTAPVFTSPAQVSVPENATTVQTVTAIDAEAPPQTITYSIAGGADQSKFAITSGGVLSFVTAPDFEAPTDAGGDNTYVVIVQASDGSLSSLQAIVVTVTPVNDNSPVFTSPAAATVLEGTTTVMTVAATDADVPAQPLALSLSGGVDISKFSLTNGQLAFLAPPNFESPTDTNGDNIYELVVQADDGNGRTTLQTLLVTVVGPPADYGDAPDASAGTGAGNYNTRAADNGPRHTIVPGLRIGASVDGDSGTFQNIAANADDVNAALPDDEDGVMNPAADLALTIGAQPTVNLRVTNTIGIAATLYGWIDYNADGVFDNATERASIAVPNGTNNGIVTLVFPTVPAGFHGATYARFRLSTDAAAADPTGAAANGEVEDYRATILKPSDLSADSSKTQLFPSHPGELGVDSDDNFGYSVGAIGDVDGDGVIDLAVGALRGNFEANHGAVHVLFMNSNGTVRGSREFTLPATPAGFAFFGRAVAGIGDLNGDGVPDIAAGERQYGSGMAPGGVRVLFLNSNGTLKSQQLITRGLNGGPNLGNRDGFGASIVSLGDLDGDGVSDLAVGAYGDNDNRGAVYVLFMNPDGTVKSSQKIASGIGGGPTLASREFFGSELASLGDLDGDGVTDLAVQGQQLYVLFLNSNGTIKTIQTIAGFGGSLASLGDLDGDGVTDLMVGAPHDDRNGVPFGGRGAVYLLLLNANGTVKRSGKIPNPSGDIGIGTPFNFGRAVTSLGDLDGDGLTDLAVGSDRWIHAGDSAGAVQVLFLKPFNNIPVFTSPSVATVQEQSTTTVMTVTATDADVPQQALAFSIVGGTDSSKFNLGSGGVLRFNAPPDFELPTDANGDNVYEVVVQADDGNGGIATQTISVTVTPVNDNAPVFTSPDTASVLEGMTSVLTVTATDADLPPQVVTYSIVGGVDQAKFSITPGGALSFKSPPDFEAPGDTNGDNIYIVIVQASDGSLTNLQAVLVTVTNTSEVPLAGDYNNSGTVDAADYLLWRNGGPLQNESVTPGQVTSEDYHVWRANFGRTVGVGAVEQGAEGGEQAAGSLERGVGSGEAGTGDAVLLRIDREDPHPLDSSRPLPTGEVKDRRLHRPMQRGAMTAHHSRDDALVAWLAARAGVLKRRSPAVFGESWDEVDLREDRSPSTDELDLAFTAILN